MSIKWRLKRDIGEAESRVVILIEGSDLTNRDFTLFAEHVALINTYAVQSITHHHDESTTIQEWE